MNAAIKPWACERGSIWPPARPFPAQNFKDKHMRKTENKQNAYKNLLMENEWRKGKELSKTKLSIQIQVSC